MMNVVEHVHDLWNRAASEVEYRTVSSRAYYGVYSQTTKLAISMGFVPSKTGADHARLPQYMASCSNHVCKTIISRRLTRLHALRKLADYNVDTKFLQSSAEDAVCSFDEVTEALDTVKQEHKKSMSKPGG